MADPLRSGAASPRTLSVSIKAAKTIPEKLTELKRHPSGTKEAAREKETGEVVSLVHPSAFIRSPSSESPVWFKRRRFLRPGLVILLAASRC